MSTMNDKYGDGSDHECCPKCGLCITCGDCELTKCGTDYSRAKLISKQLKEELKEK